MSEKERSLPEPEGKADILFLAGEHSGDEHGSLVAEAIRAERPELNLCAIGGESLEQAGCQLLFDLTESSVVGLVEVLKHYTFFKDLFKSIIDWISTHQPRVVVLIDYPGFNLRLAQRLADEGISRQGGGNVVVYQYISPQIWAWKAKRRFQMEKILDELGIIFPFERESYADTKLRVSFVGHPFLEANYTPSIRHSPEGELLILPGSRRQAVERIFPIMAKTAGKLLERGVSCEPVVLYPGPMIRDSLHVELIKQGLEDRIQLRPIREGATASAVLTSSGTISMNCALAGIPGAIVYRAHPLTYFMGKRLIKIPYLGIANIVLGETMYPEFIQHDAQVPKLVEAAERALTDDVLRSKVQEHSGKLREKLASPPDGSAASRILSWLGDNQ